VSVLVVGQSSSEIPEGLMNNPVLRVLLQRWKKTRMETSLKNNNVFTNITVKFYKLFHD